MKIQTFSKLFWLFFLRKIHKSTFTKTNKKYFSIRDPFNFQIPPFRMPLYWAQSFIHCNKQVLTDRPADCVSVFWWCVCSLSCSVICCYLGALGVFDIIPCGALFRPSLAPVGAAQRPGQVCDCRPPRCWEWGACLPPITPSPAPWNAGLYGSYPIWTPGNRGQGE